MSYSRWTNNYFYSYHKNSGGKLIEQIFVVSPDPKDVDGNYIEFEIQYGSLKKKNLRKDFIEKCCQFIKDEDSKNENRINLNNLIDKFIKDLYDEY